MFPFKTTQARSASVGLEKPMPRAQSSEPPFFSEALLEFFECRTLCAAGAVRPRAWRTGSWRNGCSGTLRSVWSCWGEESGVKLGKTADLKGFSIEDYQDYCNEKQLKPNLFLQIVVWCFFFVGWLHHRIIGFEAFPLKIVFLAFGRRTAWEFGLVHGRK